MRMLILGIVGLSGLGLAVQSIGVHGSTDERAAIRHAVRAPFADLQRRNADALCEDFTPGVAAHLASGAGGDCELRASALFRLARDAGEYVPVGAGARQRRPAMTTIHWHGDRATAGSSSSAGAGSADAWHLEMHARRWRIATPARLEMREDCGNHPFGAAGCVYAVSLRFAAG
jgi:hypothetical protein